MLRKSSVPRIHASDTGRLRHENVEVAVTKAIEAMQQNLGERITIDDVARVAMFSKFHFTRIFQKATGLSPGRYLSELRLLEAKRLLRDTELSVTEITYRVGYTSVGTFSARFKKTEGISPTDFRYQHRTANTRCLLTPVPRTTGRVELDVPLRLAASA